jgi:uncharacterized membrane protein YphA (DoxX/SURF4 family)
VPAKLAMVRELTLPVLLFLGLATRAAALTLLGMIAVIQVLCIRRPGLSASFGRRSWSTSSSKAQASSQSTIC